MFGTKNHFHNCKQTADRNVLKCVSFHKHILAFLMKGLIGNSQIAKISHMGQNEWVDVSLACFRERAGVHIAAVRIRYFYKRVRSVHDVLRTGAHKCP